MTSNQTGYQKSVSQQLLSIYVLFLGQGVSDILVFESLTVDAIERLLAIGQGSANYSLCAKFNHHKPNPGTLDQIWSQPSVYMRHMVALTLQLPN